MIIRPYKVEDLEAIDNIYTKYYAGEYSLPDLSHTVTNAVVQDGDRIVGFGLVKLWAEAVMVLDKELPRKPKVLGFDMLINHAVNACKHYKI
jgi:hypothetical protein